MQAEGGFDFDSALASLADKWVHLHCLSSPNDPCLLFTSGTPVKGSRSCFTSAILILWRPGSWHHAVSTKHHAATLQI